jgi:DNA-binding transcriptional ArsR family regulator
MVNNESRLDLAFGALGHPIRRGILARLAAGGTTVAELARPYRVSAPAISRHLRILEKAGLLARRKEGREHRCTLVERNLKEAEGWIERHCRTWNGRLDALDRYLKEKSHEKKRG